MLVGAASARQFKRAKSEKKRGEKWPRYGLKRVNKEGAGGITCFRSMLSRCFISASELRSESSCQLILWLASAVSNEGPRSRLFLGPGFRLGARWNRLAETAKTRKKREKTEKKWARYGLKSAKESGSPAASGRGSACAWSPVENIRQNMPKISRNLRQISLNFSQKFVPPRSRWPEPLPRLRPPP